MSYSTLRHAHLLIGMIALSTCSLASALELGESAELPVDPPERPITSFLKDGKLNLNIRLRYEHADIDGFGDSNAFTMRTRLGYTTARVEGFQAMVELEDNRAADYDQYNAAGLNGQPGLSVIADPVDSELNQLWIDYDFSTLSNDISLNAKIGRQRVIFDDGRFIGNVGWRQLEQTLDAVKLTSTPLEDLTATYSYVTEVNRIFGHDSGRDFDSDSHLLNVSYSGLEIGKIIGFAYLLDLGSSGAAVSSQTYGVRLDGAIDISDELALGYIGSFAFQSDYGPNTTSYDALYMLAEGRLKFIQSDAFIGAGIEVLGSDDGAIAFSTPLATGHLFNGFADSFLTTPATGLRDYYLTGGFALPDGKTKISASYHYFTADDITSGLGSELDFVVSRRLHDNVSLVAKYAYYDGENARSDIQRFWLQLDLRF